MNLLTFRLSFHLGFPAAALLAATALASPARADEWTKTYAVSAKPQLQVETGDGQVSVESWDRKEIHARVISTGARIGVGSWDSRQVNVRDEQSGDRVGLHVKVPHLHWMIGVNTLSVKIELKVPRECGLDIHTADGSISANGVKGEIVLVSGDGSIRLDGVSGQIRLRTGDGSTEADRLDGQLDASSGDGHIRVEGRFDRLELRAGDGSIHARALLGSKMLSGWSLHTGDGSIDLALPESFQANIDVRTNDGTISLGLPVTSEGGLNRTSIHGKLNGGGQPLSISTGDGSIRISRI